MSDVVHGGGGIPRDGHAEAYATELWLADPSAFWLHPEGPLSDTTPEEWLAKQPKPEPKPAYASGYSGVYLGLMNAQAQYSQLLAQNQLNAYRNQLANQYQGYRGLLGLGGML